MVILEHRLNDYRNIQKLNFSPDPGINILRGNNGQGKTNILESIWLFTGCHSFRTRKAKELVRESETQAEAEICFFSEGREQTALMRIGLKREAQLNGVWKDSPRRLLGVFQAVVFSPESLWIVKGGPSERRKFLDIAISQIRPNYAGILARYHKVLLQRNALLRQIAQGKALEESLYPWDEELARLGARIIVYRETYIAQLTKNAEEVYAGVTAGKERLSIAYERSVQGESEAALRELMKKNWSADIRRQHTAQGVHKEDISLHINDLPARSFGSQGQQRSCALALKIAEAQQLHAATGEKPVVLLDDVMSELDEQRQKDVLHYLEGWQVFITCCESSLRGGKSFSVENGRIM